MSVRIQDSCCKEQFTRKKAKVKFRLRTPLPAMTLFADTMARTSQPKVGKGKQGAGSLEQGDPAAGTEQQPQLALVSSLELAETG